MARIVRRLHDRIALVRERADHFKQPDLIAKVNVLTDDINHKVATIDPLFNAVADLSESVSDLNDQARVLGKRQSQQEARQPKQQQV